MCMCMQFAESAITAEMAEDMGDGRVVSDNADAAASIPINLMKGWFMLLYILAEK